MHFSSFLQLAGALTLALAEPIPIRQPAEIKARCLNETEPPYPYHSKHHYPHHHPSGSFIPTGTIGPLTTGPPSFTFSYPTAGPTGPGNSGSFRLSYASTATPLYPNSTADPCDQITITIPFATGATGTGTVGPISYATSGPYANTSSFDPDSSPTVYTTGSVILTTDLGTGTVPTSTSGPIFASDNATVSCSGAGTGTGASYPTFSISSFSTPLGTAGPTAGTGSGPTEIQSTLFTTFTSTIAPSFVTSWTKSVPSEYFYHHHRPHHTVSKYHRPWGYGPFHGGDGYDDDE